MGLLGMRERVNLVGGAFEIESAPAAGTTVFVRLPLEQEAPDGADPEHR
jgi:signal transduction histidine kinase